MTEVVVTSGAVRRAKLQSNRHHQQTNTQLITGWMPLLSPNQQCQITEGTECALSGDANRRRLFLCRNPNPNSNPNPNPDPLTFRTENQ